jgi:hypothetical protein
MLFALGFKRQGATKIKRGFFCFVHMDTLDASYSNEACLFQRRFVFPENNASSPGGKALDDHTICRVRGTSPLPPTISAILCSEMAGNLTNLSFFPSRQKNPKTS